MHSVHCSNTGRLYNRLPAAVANIGLIFAGNVGRFIPAKENALIFITEFYETYIL